MRPAGRGRERRALHDHEADARQAFEPFVRRRDDRLEIQGRGIDRQTAERRDRVHDQGDAAPSGHLGQRLDRIEQAGAGVDVADDHVADRGIGRERGIELRARDRLGPRQLERRERHADRRGDLAAGARRRSRCRRSAACARAAPACRAPPRSRCCPRPARARRHSRSSPCTMATRRSRISAVSASRSGSFGVKSRSMACLVSGSVVTGPGVRMIRWSCAWGMSAPGSSVAPAL